MITLLVILLLLLMIVGALPVYGWNRGFGYGPVGLIVFILLVYILLQFIRG